jgi:hypothetical protein
MSIVIRNRNEGISSFDTKDQELAIWLLRKGYELICMHTKEHSRSVIYHFAITSSIEQTAKEFYENAESKVRDHFLSILNIYQLKVMMERHEHSK